MSTAEDFRAALDGIAADNEDHALAVYAAYQAGSIASDFTTVSIAARISQGNAAAVAVADSYVQQAIEELGAPALTTGVLPEDDLERLTKAVDTILTEPSEDTPETRLTRLSTAEPFATGQRAAVDAMTRQSLVEGWVRHFESANPCQLCVWIWREGRVWPSNHPFQVMHPGDKCVPKVVLRTNIEPTRFTERLARNGR